jgi:acetyl-CoA carboxylase biotin carboxylase subunit
MTIRRLLIANRGEIAVRIVRACRGLGIESILAAADPDLRSTAARLADRTVRIGAVRSYLDVERIVAAARLTGAEAIHPGYGFLAENPALPRACEAAGIGFVGPTAEQLEAVGDKLRARSHALAAGLPVVPGGEVPDTAAGAALARELGFPLLIKAVGGGGGRGMKRVDDSAALEAAMATAMAEARGAFGDARLYLERYVLGGRHVEVQLLGDGEGVIHLGERDCSVQRRYQKLVEEAPAPGLDPELRARIHEAAVRFGEHLGYRGAGTVEFLVAAGDFHFLEMNARIQVEHPVTEAVTGIDLVEQQIAIAEGRPLALTQEDVRLTGHAIECRINAEDDDFRPSPGTVRRAAFPVGPGIRVDTHLARGADVPPFYDSLLAKLIVSGADRAEALDRLDGALARCTVEGVATNLAFHARVVAHPEFRTGGVDTAWLSSS